MAEHSISNRTIRARWAAIGAAVAVTLGAAGMGGYNLVNADISSGDRPVYIPIDPCRLIDTRPGTPNVGTRDTPLGEDETYTVAAHGENGECTGPSAIPTDATALAMNVTALNASEQTFLTFWGDGDNPGTSNLNPAPGQPPTPNAVNSPLSGAGNLNVYNELGTVNVIIDILGYYAPHDHDDRYYTEAESDARFLPIPDEVFLAPADFAAQTNDSLDVFNLTAVLNVTAVNGGAYACFSAPAHLPDGATIESVTGIVSAPNTADDFEVKFGRTLFAEGTPVLTAAGGTIAELLTATATTPDVLTHITLPIGANDAVVDNSTYAYYAQVCLRPGQTLAGFIVDLSS